MLARAIVRLRGAYRSRVGWRPYPATDEPPCAVCDSTRREIVGTRVAFAMRYTNVVCRDCGLVYLCPRPGAESFAHFYGELYPRLYGGLRLDDGPTKRGDDVVAFIADTIDLRRERGLFDVGCGSGGLLRSAAAALGSDIALAGCDPGWPAAGAIDQGGVRIPVYRKPVEELGEILGRYSTFVLYDVLEHLLDPKGFLRQLHANVRPGSFLFISTNALDHWRDIPLGGWETYYLRLAHTYSFTCDGLDSMLRATGWETVRRVAAPKGDQWVLARAGTPEPKAAAPIPGGADRSLAAIRGYKDRAG